MFIYTLSRIAWSIKSFVLCYYFVCVFWVDNHLCGWNSCDVMLCGNNIRHWICRPITVNIIFTGNETHATHCMAKMTECIEVGLPGVCVYSDGL